MAEDRAQIDPFAQPYLHRRGQFLEIGKAGGGVAQRGQARRDLHPHAVPAHAWQYVETGRDVLKLDVLGNQHLATTERQNLFYMRHGLTDVDRSALTIQRHDRLGSYIPPGRRALVGSEPELVFLYDESTIIG